MKADELVLGLVIYPQPGRHELAQRALAELPQLELGAVEGHKIPAVATISPDQDEALLSQIRATAHVLAVDVAFAQLLPTESQ